VAACLGFANAGTPDGKPVYVAKCQGCHGANGEGKAAIGKMFSVTMPVLGSKEIQAKSDADLKTSHLRRARQDEASRRIGRKAGGRRGRFYTNAEGITIPV
jgi:hypothetical protein